MDQTQHPGSPNPPAASQKGDMTGPSVSNLAAKMAHELNNPLDAALRYVSLARRKAKNGGAENINDIDRYLADAQFGLQRMAEVLRELMDIGRQTNEIISEVQPVQSPKQPLADIIARSTRTAAALAEQKHVALVVKSLLPENFHPAYDLRVAQILSNLLKNAVEASPTDSAVRLTISGQWSVASGQPSHSTDHRPLTTDHLVITVEDAGPGIAPELLPKLFTPFLTTKPKGAGHGLGLAISHELALSLKGTLTLANRQLPNTGCIATLTLPLEK